MKINFLIYIIIFIFNFIFNIHVLSINNFFILDDIGHIKNAIFSQTNIIEDIKSIQIFPNRYYNDRPIGFFVIKILNILFSDNYINYHLILFLLHFLNTILIYHLTKKILNFTSFKKNKNIIALSVSLLFISYYKGNFAIQWLAAIFDVLGLSFALIYLNISISTKNSIFDQFLSLLFYILAVRTKEAFIFFPFISFLLKFILIKKNNLLKTIDLSLLFNFIFILIYFIFKKNTQLPINDPYYSSFSPIIIINNFFKYFYIYFNIFNQNIIFSKKSIIFIILLIILFFFNFFKYKNKILFLPLLFYFFSIAPVLPLANKSDSLYLYPAQYFLGLFLILNIFQVFIFIKKTYLILPFTILFLIFVNLIIPIRKMEIKWWLNKGEKNRYLYQQLKKLPKKKNYIFTNINSEDKEISILSYGPGDVIKIIQKNKHINFFFDSLPKGLNKDYCLVDFNNYLLKVIKCL